MIKRIAHISLIVLLLFATSGITFYKHYCGNTLISKSIILKPDNCCKKPCKSCHNEAKQFKITDNFQASNSTVEFKIFVKSILDNSLPIVVLFTVFDFTSIKYLNYKVKTCDKPLPIADKSTASLQVFRLWFSFTVIISRSSFYN